jgi:hypothetical protein
VISDAIFAYHCLLRFLSKVRVFVLRVFREGGLAEKSATFLTEVAVLVLVFPILDTIVEKGQSKVTPSLVIWSILIAVGCLFLAGVISMIAKER